MEVRGAEGISETYTLGGIAALVPALNEEVTIGSVVLRLNELVGTVLVVDDGSTDKTSEVARKAGAEVIRLEENQGKSFAVKTGMKELSKRNLRAVVMLDGDGQHKVEDPPPGAGTRSSRRGGPGDRLKAHGERA